MSEPNPAFTAAHPSPPLQTDLASGPQPAARLRPACG